jgi:hypothetical protein
VFHTVIDSGDRRGELRPDIDVRPGDGHDRRQLPVRTVHVERPVRCASSPTRHRRLRARQRPALSQAAGPRGRRPRNGQASRRAISCSTAPRSYGWPVITMRWVAPASRNASSCRRRRARSPRCARSRDGSRPISAHQLSSTEFLWANVSGGTERVPRVGVLGGELQGDLLARAADQQRQVADRRGTAARGAPSTGQIVAQLVEPVDRRAELVAVLGVVALEPARRRCRGTCGRPTRGRQCAPCRRAAPGCGSCCR